MKRFEREQPIRFAHCDPAGIVFYPRVFELFQGLVEDWFTEGLGLDYAELLGPRRIGLPTVALQTDFRAISRQGERVRLTLQLERLGRSSVSLLLQLLGPDGQPRVTARQTLVSTDLDTHRAQALPPDVRAALLRFQDPEAAHV